MAAAQTRIDQMRDLVNQWQQLVGYSMTVTDWAVTEMSDHPNQFATLFDVGQYMMGHRQGSGTGAPSGASFIPGWYDTMPWAQFGMSANEYHSTYAGFDAVFRKLTGHALEPGVILHVLRNMGGALSATEFETWMMGEDSIKNTYGWLKYGLDFNQFQQQKLDMRTHFGRDLTDAEAVTQLQYYHQAQGTNQAVGVVPTLTQQEKKTSQQGISGNVVR